VSGGRLPVAVAVVGLVVAMVASFAIGTPPTTRRGDAAARSFLDAWRRSRTSTFVVHSTFVRTLPDGGHLDSFVDVVQRPPDDRLVIGLGSVSGRLGGKLVRCAGAPDGTTSCVTAEEASPYDAEVASELDGLTSYLRSPRPLYRVLDFGGGHDHCFRLDLAIALPSPPYGDHALFCFDAATGAPSLTEVQRPEATDRTVAVTIRSQVQPDDLRIPDDRGQVVGAPGAGG